MIKKIKETFHRKITQPFLKGVHLQKGTKDTFLDYRLPFVKAYQFSELNDEEG